MKTHLRMCWPQLKQNIREIYNHKCLITKRKESSQFNDFKFYLNKYRKKRKIKSKASC